MASFNSQIEKFWYSRYQHLRNKWKKKSFNKMMRLKIRQDIEFIPNYKKFKGYA